MNYTYVAIFCIVISLKYLLANENITSWEQRARLKRQSDNLCTLPPYPANGQYTVGGAPDARPGQILPAAHLVITCYPGYMPKGHATVNCVTGIWSYDIPACVKHCRLDSHPSVRYRCSVSENGLDDGFRDCQEYEPTGTTVKPECKKPDYYYNGLKSLMRCINGRWDHTVICTADCGRVTPDGITLVAEGYVARRGEFPWHAGIYLKPTVQGESYRLNCGGSIISTRVVISAAHCFWSRGRVRPPSAVAVAVGKLYREWNSPNDEDAQTFDVTTIKIPARYQDWATHYQDDIAAVTLSAAIVYRPHVRPVCVDFDQFFDRTQLRHGSIGKLAGWGYVDAAGTLSNILKVLEMPFIRVEDCIAEATSNFSPLITSDKICAGYQNGSAVCRGDSGGGLVFPFNDRGVERYYLRGIVSTAPKSDDSEECNVYSRATFTHILAHTAFIEENTVVFDTSISTQQDSFNSPPCVLPPYPRNGKYSVAGTPGAVPGQIFLTAQLEIKCNPEFIPEENVSPTCSYGRWSDNVPQCVRQCTLPEDNNSYRCSKQNGEEYDCGQLEPSGVTAKILCSGKFSEGVECVNGRWSEPLKCGGTGNCILPPFPEHGKYIAANVAEATPGKRLESVSITVTCDSGYEVNGDANLLCIDGKWSAEMPVCIRYCQLNPHPSVQYFCDINDGSSVGERPCGANEPTGTTVNPKCNAPNYYYPGVLNKMRCIDGVWDYIAICNQECGRVAQQQTSLRRRRVIDGRAAYLGELPWHAGIYTKTSTPYMQICAGSLVSTTAVISVAHCFWDDGVGKVRPAANYAVAVGKIYRPWNYSMDQYEQKSDVSEIKIPRRFQGAAANFQEDIAVVILSTAVTYKIYVRPVCVDFDFNLDRNQLQSGNLGKVGGWGLTSEDGAPSPVLKVVELPYVDVLDCISRSPPDFRAYITSDKICAGWGNGTAVCRGDTGGGLVFPVQDRGVERFYLRAVVSTGPVSDHSCNKDALVALTHVLKHEHFVKQYIKP